MPSTARGVLPYPLETDTPDVPRDILAIANRLAAIAVVFIQDLQVNKPAANAMGGAGFLFWGSDSHLLSYSDGAAWVDINPTSSAAFLNSPGSAIFQQGVVNPGEGIVSRLTNSAVRVAAGNAWIDGDGVVGSGRYPCTWVQTDLVSIPAAAAGVSRIDRVIVRLQGQFGVTPTVERLAGGEANGQTLDNRTLAAAIPNGCLHVADVMIDNTGVVATNSCRSRRTFAGGWKQTIMRHSNAGGTNDYTTNSGSWVVVDTTNFDGKYEVKQGNCMELVMTADFQGPNPTLVQFNIGDSSSQEIHFTDLPGSGSGYYAQKTLRQVDDTYAAGGITAGEESGWAGWDFEWSTLAIGTATMTARPGTPAIVTLTERPVGPTVANTKDH